MKNTFSLKKAYENFYTFQKRQINKISRWGILMALIVCLGVVVFGFQNCGQDHIGSEGDLSFTEMPSEQDVIDAPNAQSLGIVQDEWASTAPARSSASLPQQAMSENLQNSDHLKNSNNQQNLQSLQIRLPSQGVNKDSDGGSIGGVVSGSVQLEPIAEVVSSQPSSRSRIRRLRSPTLSSDRLVVVAKNASGEEIDYQVLHNPFTIRSESFNPDGSISDVVVEKDPNPQIQMSAPAEAESLIFYQPVEHAGQNILVPVARVPVK